MSAPGDVRQAAVTRDDWATPQAVFDKLNAEFRFGLDAAASLENRKASRYLPGPCDDSDVCFCGLCSSWAAPRTGAINTQPVFLNPPYGKGLIRWINKCANEAAGGLTVVALLPDSLDTAWFRLVFATAWEIRIVYGRIQFDGTTSSNPCGSILAVWRPGQRPYGQPVFSIWEQA